MSKSDPDAVIAPSVIVVYPCGGTKSAPTSMHRLRNQYEEHKSLDKRLIGVLMIPIHQKVLADCRISNKRQKETHHKHPKNNKDCHMGEPHSKQWKNVYAG